MPTVPGVVYQQVDSTKGRLRMGRARKRLLPIAHVAGKDDGLAAVPLDFFPEFVKRVFAASDQADARTLPGQAKGDESADATRCTRYQGTEV